MNTKTIEDDADFQALCGKTITKLEVSDDETSLVFTTTEGVFFYRVYGDCCSESWFADITGVNALIGGTVIGQGTVDMADVNDDRTRQDVDTVYGFKMMTTKGYVDIVFRNSSNGYYGGSMVRKTGLYHDTKLIEITDDWSA